MWWKRLSFFVSLIALLGSVFPTSASALTAEEAVMPWRDDIRLMEEVLAEIQRQADQRQNEL